MSLPSRLINLNYVAILREQRGVQSEKIETTASSPRGLYTELASIHPFTLPVDRVGVAVNDEFVTLDHTLSEGDSVTFIPPVAGG